MVGMHVYAHNLRVSTRTHFLFTYRFFTILAQDKKKVNIKNWAKGDS